MKTKIAIFASGEGTNAERIMSVFAKNGEIEVALLLASKEGIGALQKAEAAGVPSVVFPRTAFAETEPILSVLQNYKVDFIVLAGFLVHIPEWMLRVYPNRLINIHPSLLPKFGGKGMFGLRIHQAVLEAAEQESGITIHLVNELYDSGDILFQATCSVKSDDSAEALAARVHELEYKYYPEVVEEWIKQNRN